MEQNNPELQFLLQVRMNNIKGVEELLNFNPKLINSLDEYESNALIYALKDGNAELAHLLINKGINIFQVDKFNTTSFDLAKKINNQELIDLLDQTNKKIFVQNVSHSQRKRNNPLNAFDLENFISWEISGEYTPFPPIDACSVFNCEVRTFLGVGTLFLSTTVSKTQGHHALQPYVAQKDRNIGQTILVDYITEPPEFKGDVVQLKSLWRKALFEDNFIKKRTEFLEKRGILYIIDYDLNNIVAAINYVVNV